MFDEAVNIRVFAVQIKETEIPIALGNNYIQDFIEGFVDEIFFFAVKKIAGRNNALFQIGEDFFHDYKELLFRGLNYNIFLNELDSFFRIINYLNQIHIGRGNFAFFQHSIFQPVY